MFYKQQTVYAPALLALLDKLLLEAEGIAPTHSTEFYYFALSHGVQAQITLRLCTR
jgi:hypothetical protein